MKVTDSPAVWRAVAHPVRRRIIELLGEQPRTTGYLAGLFPLSRFAVMKHLAVLERSGMITARRDGRERWNALTVRAALDFTRLGPSGGGPLEASPPLPAIELPVPAGGLSPFRVEQEVVLAASPARVFDGLTFNVAAWWGAPYLRSSRATNLVLEPQLGGRFFEEWGHRQGFIRGSVTAIRQDERLELTGRIAGDGPLPAVLEFVLVSVERGTRLALRHRGVAEREAGGSAGGPSLYAGVWADLVGVRLKAFLERGVRSGIGERPPAADALFGWF
jgi:DNA-binding transcriptional ArsR family regulator/uncharacterized protein YndB with AHSA1/START domain